MSDLRRGIIANSNNSGGNIFPMYLNLKKISNTEYRLDPTPESIALCDYFIENAEFEGVMNWELNIEPGHLYIDDVEVTYLRVMGYADKVFHTRDSGWYPHNSKYDFFLKSWW